MFRIKRIFKRKHLKKLIISFLLLLGFLVFLYQQNNMITTTQLTVESDRLPESFDGYRILHLSDLHGKSFGKNQKDLVDKIEEAHPDVIFFTGDLIDSRRYNEEHSLELLKRITDIAEVYYVNGNHEGRSGRFDGLEKSLLDIGVNVLRNTTKTIEKGSDEIYLMGLDDPTFDYRIQGKWMSIKDVLAHLHEGIDNEDSFKILLSHRPEIFPLYSQSNIDVTLSGHAHGGQIRLPFIGGILAPGQGFFPKYHTGKYEENGSSLIVSRGLGNSIFPQRLFNRPDIIIVELKKK